MAIEIEKGVPLPDPSTRHGKYPFYQMEVGDSFTLPLTGTREGKNQCGNPKWDTATRKLANSAHDHGRRRGKKFTVRQLRDKGVARVWRIA